MARLIGASVLASLNAWTAAASCETIDRVALQLSWVTQPQFAGWEVPNSDLADAPKYLDECLFVNVRAGTVQINSMEELLSDRADIALGEGAYVADLIDQGHDLTIIGNYFQKSSILLTANSGVTMEDLEGADVGAWIATGQGIVVDMMLRAAGINGNMVQQGWTPWGILEGTIKAASVMVYNELAMLLEKIDPNTNFLAQLESLSLISPDTYDVPFLHSVAVVKTSRIAELRPIIVRVLRVVSRTWIFCRDNEEKCVNTYAIAGPHRMWMMRALNKVIYPSPLGIGVVNLADWEKMTEAAVRTGLTESRVPNSAIDNSMMLEAIDGPEFEIAKEEFDKPFIKFCAAYGSESFEVCDGFEHTLCDVGKTPNGVTDMTDCEDCPLGTFSYELGAQVKGDGSDQECAPTCPARMLKCMECGEGQYQDTAGSSKCKLCDSGTYRNLTMNPTTCSTCAPGFEATQSGMTACAACQPGQFKSNVNDVTCTRCPRGSYAIDFGLSECTTCPQGMDTLTTGSWVAADCVCPSGKYADTAGKCQPCPEGMSCEAGSTEENLRKVAAGQSVEGPRPTVDKGFWVSRADPLSVYACIEEAACLGGDPESCGDNREDIACAVCKDGYTSTGEACEKCDDVAKSGFMYPWLPIIVGPAICVLLYMMARDSVEVAWSKWTTVLNSLFLLTFIHYQTVGLVMGDAVDWTASSSDVLGVWEGVVDVSKLIQPGCMGYSSLMSNMLLKTLMPVHVMLTFVLTWAVAFAISKVAKPEWKMDGNLLFSACMAVIQTFFVSVAFIAMQLFMCYDHPNGKASLRMAPEVMCDSDEWKETVGVGIVAILVYVVGLLGFFAYQMAMAPVRFQDTIFRKRFKFLLLRMRPGAWWWSVVMLLKGLFISMAQVLFTDGILQVYWTFFVLLLYTSGLALTFPWLHPYANFLDFSACASLLFFAALTGFFCEQNSKHDTVVTAFMLVNSFVPMVIFVSCAAMLFASKANDFAAKKKFSGLVGADLLRVSRVLGRLPEATVTEWVDKLSMQDLETIDLGTGVVVADLLGEQPGRGWFLGRKRLVLPKTEDAQLMLKAAETNPEPNKATYEFTGGQVSV